MQHEYLVFLTGLGWVVNAMIGWLGAGLPGALSRRAAMMLVLYSGVQSAIEALSRFTSDAGPTAAHVLDILTLANYAALWECARAFYTDTAKRRWPAATQLPLVFTVGCLAIAPYLAAGPAARFCTFVATWAGLALPLAFGLTTGFLFWRWVQQSEPRPWSARIALHLAALGLALMGAVFHPHGVPADLDPVRTSIPWMLVVGVAVAGMGATAARSRMTVGFAVALALTPLINPLVAQANVRNADRTWRTRLTQRAENIARNPAAQAAAAFAARGDPVPESIYRPLAERLLAEYAKDAGLRVAHVWQLRDGEVVSIVNGTPHSHEPAAPGARYRRPAIAEELSQLEAGKTFFARGDAADLWPLVTAAAPLFSEGNPRPVAWVALEYPLAWWRDRLDSARRATAWISVIFSIFIAGGLVLSWQQAVESGRTLQIERSEAANRAKTEFLTLLSHELRTPLQTILGRAELLRDPPAGTVPDRATTVRHGAAIEAQSRLLLRLVTDLLDLGTIEAGRLDLRLAPVSLRSVIAAIDDAHRPAAAALGLAFHVGVAPDVPDTFLADETRLRQILGNLLHNAIKFTTTGTVTLRVMRGDPATSIASPDTCCLNFIVEDTGPGLPPDKLDRLFTLFTRLDPGEGLRREGTGVGLALVRRLCALMDGTVTAANRPTGGAAFTAQLRLTTTVSPAAAHPPPPAANALLPRLRVLVVEDNAAARELLAEALQAGGHDVDLAPTGQAALSAFAARAPDVVILDLNLPDLDGLEIARRLRAAAAPARGPRIVGCSAEAFAATRDAALAAGMDEFLSKPVSIHELARALGRSAPSISEAPPDDIFSRLHTPSAAGRVHAALRSEWPRLRATAESSLAANDRAALRRLGHYLQTTALLLDDRALAELCTRLAAAAAPGSSENPRALLAAVDSHVAGWPPSP